MSGHLGCSTPRNLGVPPRSVSPYDQNVGRNLAARAREEVACLARSGLDWVTFAGAATDVIGEVVPFDRCCWHTVDPGTVLLTGSVNLHVACSGLWLAEHEYVVDDVNQWWFLARSGRLAGATSLATNGDLSLSARHRSQEAIGVGDELRGADRYTTAIAVADALGNPATTLLASGRDYPDALAAGPAAAKTGGAVLLTTDDTLGATTTAYLSAHPGTIYAIGGPAATADPAATRLVGADRYTTATAVATRFFGAPSHVGVATGANYPDALTGGALVAAAGGPVLLADANHTDAATAYLSQIRGGIDTCWVFGDIDAIPNPVADALTTTLHG